MGNRMKFEPKVGDYVKISFDGETMWVKITVIRETPIWQGVLSNDPIGGGKFGDIIEFEVGEVIQYQKSEEVVFHS